MTRTLAIDPQHPEPAAIAEAAAVLRAGGLVAFPTETVYGLGALALDPVAVRRIFDAKGRPHSDPVIVHIRGSVDLPLVAGQVSAQAAGLAARFWPGPLTLVLPRSEAVPDIVTAGGPGVGLRAPSHPVAAALIAAAGPIAAPSANRFARPSPTAAQHVLDDLEGEIDLLLDGGPVPIGVESTVLDLTVDPPAVLRPGGVPVEALRVLLPGLVFAPRYLDEADELSAPAPGMFLRHYAPSATVICFDGPREEALAAMRRRAQSMQQNGVKVGILAEPADAAELAGLGLAIYVPPEAHEIGGLAAGLFGGLRALEAAGVDAILARLPDPQGLGLAVRDRLIRAAEGRVERAG